MASSGRDGLSPQLWLIWGAMTSTPLIYGLVGYLLWQQGFTPVSPEVRPVMTAVFTVLGLIQTVGLFTWLPRLAAKLNYQNYSIMRWAFAEAIAAYGLILFFMGATAPTFGLFLGWAFLLELFLRPTQDDLDRFELLKRGDG